MTCLDLLVSSSTLSSIRVKMAEKKGKARARKAAIEKEFAIELREYELKK